MKTKNFSILLRPIGKEKRFMASLFSASHLPPQQLNTEYWPSFTQSEFTSSDCPYLLSLMLLLSCSCTSIFHNRSLPCPSQVQKHCMQPVFSSFYSYLCTCCSLYKGNPSLAPLPLTVSYLFFGNSNGIPLGDMLCSSTESSTSTSILSGP